MKYKCISQRARFISCEAKIVRSDTIYCGEIIDDARAEIKDNYLTIVPIKVRKEIQASLGLNYLKEDFEEVKEFTGIPIFKYGQKVFNPRINARGKISHTTIDVSGRITYNVDGDNGEHYIFVEEDTITEEGTMYEDKFVWKEENKMELKELNKINLKEAKAQFDIEKANQEIEFAKRKLRELTDRKDTLTREIKVRNDEISKLDEELKVFK